jgi:hypothetical protein
MDPEDILEYIRRIGVASHPPLILSLSLSLSPSFSSSLHVGSTRARTPWRVWRISCRF